MPGYRSDEVALRARLEELQTETRAAEAAFAEVALSLIERERLELRTRLLSKRWDVVLAVVFASVVVAVGWIRTSAEARSRIEAIEPAERELVLAESELREAESKRAPEREAELPVDEDGALETRVANALMAMTLLDASTSAEAWEIMAGIACIRGDKALYQRAARAGAPSVGAIRLACASLVEP